VGAFRESKMQGDGLHLICCFKAGKLEVGEGASIYRGGAG
jgi:hypothetical protein